MANARDWRLGVDMVNLIGLSNFISTVIGPNLTSCHGKLILVTPLGSKTRKLGAFGSYIPTSVQKLDKKEMCVNLRIYNRETENV